MPLVFSILTYVNAPRPAILLRFRHQFRTDALLCMSLEGIFEAIIATLDPVVSNNGLGSHDQKSVRTRMKISQLS